MSSQVHLEDFQGFRCTSCGLCCTRRWGVGVERAVEPGIRASRLFARRTSQGYHPLEVQSDAPTRAGKKEDGSCVFLDEGTQCGLHRELGSQGKPVGCQLYPYRPVRTPTGVYVSQSFACPAVVAGLDRNVEENRAHLEALLAQFPDSAPTLLVQEFPVRLTQQTSISWSSYLQLEERLLVAYDPGRPLDSLFFLAHGVLAREAGSGGATIETWAPFPTTGPSWEMERLLLRSYLIAVVSLLEGGDDLAHILKLQEALDHGQQLVSVLIDGPLPALDSVLNGPGTPTLGIVFERYFANTVRGKLLLAPTLVARLLAVAIGYTLAELYLAGLVQRSGPDHNEAKAMARAFEIMEADAISHSQQLDAFFLSFEETLTRFWSVDAPT